MIGNKIFGMNSISNKLLVSILIFSSCITMIIAFIQLYVEYEEGLDKIEKEIKYIKERQFGSLAFAVWALNKMQVDSVLKSISYSPNISYVRISDPKANFLMEYGDASLASHKTITHRLTHFVSPGRGHEVGVVELNVSYYALYAHLKKRVMFILLGKFVKTFVFSFFILWIVGTLVIKDLNLMASFLAKLQFPRDNGKTFPNRRKMVKDEFDVVVDSFNDMTLRLDKSYKQIHIWNDGLEDIVAQRMVDIKKLQEKNGHLIRVLCHDVANSSMAISLVEYKLRRLLNSFSKSHEEEETFSKLTKTLRANTKRQQEILKQVRDVVLASEEESILVDLESVNIDELFIEITQSFNEQLSEKNIKVNHCVKGSTRGFRVDYSVFKNNILSNVMGNAIKYSHENSVIDLKFHSNGNRQYISVINYGNLISTDEIAGILSLQRVESNPGTMGETGSGIGLMIVQKCLKAHDGHLEIFRGTDVNPFVEFRLHLPIKNRAFFAHQGEVRA